MGTKGVTGLRCAEGVLASARGIDLLDDQPVPVLERDVQAGVDRTDHEGPTGVAQEVVDERVVDLDLDVCRGRGECRRHGGHEEAHPEQERSERPPRKSGRRSVHRRLLRSPARHARCAPTPVCLIDAAGRVHVCPKLGGARNQEVLADRLRRSPPRTSGPRIRDPKRPPSRRCSAWHSAAGPTPGRGRPVPAATRRRMASCRPPRRARIASACSSDVVVRPEVERELHRLGDRARGIVA